MNNPNTAVTALSILAFITFGAFLGYLGGRTLTRVEQRAAHNMWKNHS